MVDDDKVKKAMLERDARLNPPSVEPGMEDNWSNDSWGDEWSTGGASGASGEADSWGSSTGADSWGTDWSSAGNNSLSTQVNTPQSNVEEKVFEGVVVGFKGFSSFLKEMATSFKTFDSYKKMVMGKRIIGVSAVTAIVGVVVLAFKHKIGFDFMIGGLLGLGTGVPIFMFGYEDFQKSGGVIPTKAPEVDSWGTAEDPLIDGGSDESADDWDTIDFDDKFGDDSKENEDSSEIDLFFEDEEEEEPKNSVISKEDILKDVPEDSRFITKSFLYEKIIDYLKENQPDFGKNTELQGRKFELLCSAVDEAGEQIKTGKSEDTVYLIKATEKLFYIDLEIHRAKWIKNIENFKEEIISIYRYHEELGNKGKGIYGTCEAVGDKIFIKIMKGATAMVTLKDTYKEVETEVLSRKYKMPIVLGIDLEGGVAIQDFWGVNSILVTGMPRKGKSWFVQAIITQMMFYFSPRDLNFYIFDPKGDISDFKDMTMPHVRKFVSKEDAMLKELKHVVEVEGPRRKKIIGDAGFVNINDYKEKNPDAEMPLLYIMIDEVVTLAESMDKETKDEFQSLLLVLVSQLPALGIRIIMVPHVVKDQIIKKSTTDLIPCRVSVCGDAGHIESSTGTKERDFPEKLTHPGDMAVRFNNDPTKFIHSVILTTSNLDNADLFDFLTKLWCKLDPESYKGSYGEQKELGLVFKDKAVGITSIESGVSVSSPKRQVTMNTKKVLNETEIHKTLKGIHDEVKKPVVTSYEEQEDLWDEID